MIIVNLPKLAILLILQNIVIVVNLVKLAILVILLMCHSDKTGDSDYSGDSDDSVESGDSG